MNLDKYFSLGDQVALVVGASRGIGRAIAEALGEAGARVVLAARSLDKLEAVAAAIRGQAAQASTLRLDVADPASISAGVEQVLRDHGRLDILVNVAGTNIRKRAEDYTLEEFDAVLSTNLRGIFRVTQVVGAAMKRQRKGKIINIGSLTTTLGFPYLSVYAVTKGGLGQLSKVLAVEWAPYNIQVNVIAPGFILTDLTREMWQREDMRDWLAATQPNPRLGTPEDIAGMAIFLASPASDYITGQVIFVDGGNTAGSRWPFQPSA
ncbi:MAG: 3-oxoacyl-ACP reductase FabG [Acidobacteria bacterium]|nr:3-oxoacyl-ACP reductase FabG [Acidobacteriota bacterium]